ncbi:hypothetical protein GCM10010532_062210 [Dactylosporangium siamense]|uniref:Uncharacterized protein n=1 Tax=Dactylosporangium siamense TaxID=685454 RepID=A0A919PWY5_9ACTN|nr:hypothetical protein Dsi01nite_088070 [Dactylosporangium siamense]
MSELTTNSGYHRWAHKLNGALIAIRAGTPVDEALAAHHIPLNAALAESVRRGEPTILDDLRLDPVAVTGAYGCPAVAPTVPCSRRAEPDAAGHEPRCGVYDRTMTRRRE